MERKILVYIGSRKGAEVTVRRAPVLSSFRTIQVEPGKCFYVGRDIPEIYAKGLAADLPALFKIETEEVESVEIVTEKIAEAAQSMKDLGVSLDEVSDSIVELFGFDSFSSDSDGPSRKSARTNQRKAKKKGEQE